MRAIISFCLLIFLVSTSTIAQQHQGGQGRGHRHGAQNRNPKTDAHLIGHILNGGKHIPFASVYLKGTTIGTSTDETGHYRFINLPEGDFTVVAAAVGFKKVEKAVTIKAGETVELNFSLEEDAIGLDEVVITGDRNGRPRRESSVVVNTITPETFTMTQSVTLGDGLNFSPGLRMENNCQNCGFTQLRMNGLEGAYSQILINSRPIFSGLAGVYGLELIPSNMVDRVEVIRGGGSALYGSNAIAGTVNLILKDPINNSYEMSINSGLTGVGMSNASAITDHNVTFSATAVSSDIKTGLAVFGFVRDRDPFDANNDGFSELASISNTSIGARAFHRFGHRSKLTADFFNIREDRRGGDSHDLPLHQADIAEAVTHNITTGALTYDQFFRESDVFSVFVSAQHVDRDSYYGAEKSLSDYGHTADLTYTFGTQYRMQLNGAGLILGIENQGGRLKDQKLGYPVYSIDNDEIIIEHTDNMVVADQTQNITGAFAQVEYNYNKLQATAGLRFDHYNISNRENPDSDISGNVLSPRVTLMYNFNPNIQARASYAKGYRAPQVFDEDLHIETSGSRQVIHRNAPGLKQETSPSFMSSVDFNYQIGSLPSSLLMEGFYTLLQNPFANEFGDPDENGVVEYLRVNEEEGAVVQGINVELTLMPSSNFTLRSGFTVQKSEYQEEQEFDERRFMRTPNNYGYFTADWNPTKKLNISSTGTYTGKMLIPYFGPQLDDPEEGELRESNPFFDLGLRIGYDIKVNGATLQVFGGVKNIFNSYQSDFDSGIDRDPGYMYGPNQPRMVYLGLRIGNRLR